MAASILDAIASWNQDQAGIESRTAGYQRRVDEWTLQANLAARELTQAGRQIIASLIAEQVAYHDYVTVKTQVQQAQAVQSFLQDKFTNAALYTWMQSDLSDPLGSQATKELVTMLDTAGQSGQALLFCLRYDFPTEWAAFVNGTADFQVTLEKQYFPYAVQSARVLTIDALTLYAERNASIASVSPVESAGLSALTTGLSGATGAATLTLPSDGTVMVQDQAQQVFLVLQYHFGTA